MRKKERQGLEKKGGRGGRGGGIENANPAGSFPPVPHSPVSYPKLYVHAEHRA